MLFGNESDDDDDNSILGDDEQLVHAASGASAAADAAMAWMMDDEGNSDESSQSRSVAAVGVDSDGESVHAVSDAVAVATMRMRRILRKILGFPLFHIVQDITFLQ